jgi:hypothetical protein
MSMVQVPTAPHSFRLLGLSRDNSFVGLGMLLWGAAQGY